MTFKIQSPEQLPCSKRIIYTKMSRNEFWAIYVFYIFVVLMILSIAVVFFIPEKFNMWLQVFKALMFMWTRLETQKGTTLSWPWQDHLKVNPILDPSAVSIETRVTLESLWVLVQLLKSISNKHFWIFAITLKTLYSFVVFREQLKEVSNDH